jgi:hypothetical protein
MAQNLDTAPPAVRLLARWCRGAATDAALRQRLKLVCVIDNLAEVAPSMPTMIAKHNGKPVLVTGSGSFFSGLLPIAAPDAGADDDADAAAAAAAAAAGGGRYVEVDVNVHKWNIVALQVLESWRECSPDLVLHAALVIEAREDEEMPECVLGTVELRGLDLTSW